MFIMSCEKDDDIIPEITTEIGNVTNNSASFNGEYYSGGNYSEVGVCWNTSGNSTTNDFKLEGKNPKYSAWFYGDLTNLKQNTKYFARCYVVSGKKTYYGNEVSFKTLDHSTEILLPTITTNVLESSITSTSANVMSTAINVENLNEVGIRYSSKVMPDIANLDISIYNIKCKYNADGSFSAELTNLTPSTTYYIISYVINEKGRFNSIMLTIKTK
jgi:hypothetical protein